MINRDPFGEICEDILDMGTYATRIIEIRLWYTGKRIQLLLESIAIVAIYHATIAWSYIIELLQLWRLLPPPTKEELAIAFDQLRLKIAETQYDDHPGTLAANAKAQSLIDAYDKSRQP